MNINKLRIGQKVRDKSTKKEYIVLGIKDRQVSSYNLYLSDMTNNRFWDNDYLYEDSSGKLKRLANKIITIIIKNRL